METEIWNPWKNKKEKGREKMRGIKKKDRRIPTEKE